MTTRDSSQEQMNGIITIISLWKYASSVPGNDSN
jgi:hypothetical protein